LKWLNTRLFKIIAEAVHGSYDIGNGIFRFFDVFDGADRSNLLMLTKFQLQEHARSEILWCRFVGPNPTLDSVHLRLKLVSPEAYIADLANPEINTPHGTALACGALPFSK
jgi:hypothetical protein